MKYFNTILLTFLFVSSLQAFCRVDTVYQYTYPTGTSIKFLVGRRVNTYDSNNLLIQTIGQTGSNFTTSSKTTYTHTTSKKIKSELYETWNATSSSWEKYSQTNYMYNFNSNLTNYLYLLWNGTTWIKSTENTRTFNSKNNLLENITLFFNSTTGQVTYGSRSQTLYDSSEKQLSIYNYSWNFSDFYLDNVDTNFIYNTKNMIVSNERMSWNSVTNSFTKTFRNTYTYDANDLLKKVLYEKYNGANLENSAQVLYVYNSKKNPTEFQFQNWDLINLKWLHAYKNTYEYNSSDDLIATDTYQDVDITTNTFKYHGREENICTFISANKDIIQNTIQIDVYPNPSIDGTVKVKIPENADYTLLDISGRELIRGKFLEGENTLNLYQLNISGIILLKIGNNIVKIIHQN